MSISINSSGLQLDQLGSQIKASIRAAEHSEGKTLNHYKAAGLYLQEAKRRVEAGEYEGNNFSHYCSRYAQISVSRAYELVAIADGRKAPDAEATRHKEYRESFRSQAEKRQPPVFVQKNVKQPNNLGGRPVADELSHLRSLISKQVKLMQTKEQLVNALELITKLNN